MRHIAAYSAILNMDRTTVTLPKAIAKWAKAFAKKNGQSFSGFLRVMIEDKKAAAESVQK